MANQEETNQEKSLVWGSLLPIGLWFLMIYFVNEAFGNAAVGALLCGIGLYGMKK